LFAENLLTSLATVGFSDDVRR